MFFKSSLFKLENILHNYTPPLLLGSIQIFWKDNIGDQHFREQQEGIILIQADYIKMKKTVTL